MKKNPAAVALGKIKSAKKSAASRENGQDQRPHFRKVAHFLSVFPHHLQDNEWHDKFPIGLTMTGRIATYNPDYFCHALNCYVEVTTSKGNIVEQGWKWREAMKRGLALRVYSWEGEELTNQFKNGKLGGRQKKPKRSARLPNIRR